MDKNLRNDVLSLQDLENSKSHSQNSARNSRDEYKDSQIPHFSIGNELWIDSNANFQKRMKEYFSRPRPPVFSIPMEELLMSKAALILEDVLITSIETSYSTVVRINPSEHSKMIRAFHAAAEEMAKASNRKFNFLEDDYRKMIAPAVTACLKEMGFQEKDFEFKFSMSNSSLKFHVQKGAQQITPIAKPTQTEQIQA
jgi:hypothetical protein